MGGGVGFFAGIGVVLVPDEGAFVLEVLLFAMFALRRPMRLQNDSARVSIPIPTSDFLWFLLTSRQLPMKWHAHTALTHGGYGRATSSFIHRGMTKSLATNRSRDSGRVQ